MAISMAQGYSVLDLGKQVEEELEALRQSLPLGIDLTLVSDQPKVVARTKEVD